MRLTLVTVLAFGALVGVPHAVEARQVAGGAPLTVEAPRQDSFAPRADAATRLQNFEVTRRMARYSPAEHQRVQGRAAGLLAATGTSCDMVNAAELGRTERRRDVLEVACSNGYGYILVGSSPPVAYDCLQLSRAAQVVRASNRRADVGSQCALRENGG